MRKRISLQDLPLGTYIRFGKRKGNGFVEDKEFLHSFIEEFKNKAQDVKSISKEIGVPRTLVYKILNAGKNKIRLEYLIKIADFLRRNGVKKYVLSKLQNRIYSLSCPRKGELKTFIKENGKIKIKFPFKLDGPEAMKALTFPFTDGYILEDYSGYVRLGYVNSNLKMHHEVVQCVRNTFGDVDYSQRRISGAYETYFAGILGRIYVESLGFVPKNKLKTNVRLHEILTNLKDRTEIGACLSQIMDDEGSFNQMTFYVGVSGGKVPEDRINEILDNCRSPEIQQKYMPNILKDVRAMLEKVSIHVTVKRPVRYVDHTEEATKLMWYLVICGPANLLRLYSFCDFKNKKLKEKFEKYVKHRQNMNKLLKNLERRDGFFTVNSVKTALNISMESARNIIKIMKRDKLLEESEGGRYEYLREAKKLKYLQAKFRLAIPSTD